MPVEKLTYSGKSTTAENTAKQEAVLLFDGHCLLCDGFVQWLLRHDPAQRLRFAALASLAGQRLLTAHGLPATYRDSLVVLHAGQVFTQSAAVRTVLRMLGGPYRWLAGLLGIVPRAMRDAGYRFVARHRYRWFGQRDESCPIPPPEVRERFLAA